LNSLWTHDIKIVNKYLLIDLIHSFTYLLLFFLYTVCRSLFIFTETMSFTTDKSCIVPFRFSFIVELIELTWIFIHLFTKVVCCRINEFMFCYHLSHVQCQKHEYVWLNMYQREKWFRQKLQTKMKNTFYVQYPFPTGLLFLR
jgi:hypothetical protein